MNKKKLINFINQGVLQIRPDEKKWLTFTSNLLLWISCLGRSFSVMFFIAYNWNKLGPFAKFAMVEVLMILSISAFCKLEKIQPQVNQPFFKQ